MTGMNNFIDGVLAATTARTDAIDVSDIGVAAVTSTTILYFFLQHPSERKEDLAVIKPMHCSTDSWTAKTPVLACVD